MERGSFFLTGFAMQYRPARSDAEQAAIDTAAAFLKRLDLCGVKPVGIYAFDDPIRNGLHTENGFDGAYIVGFAPIYRGIPVYGFTGKYYGSDAGALDAGYMEIEYAEAPEQETVNVTVRDGRVVSCMWMQPFHVTETVNENVQLLPFDRIAEIFRKNIVLSIFLDEKSDALYLNVTDNTAMTRLYCYNNKLSSLDVSTLTNLTNLQCNSNRLTELNVNNNTKLQYLNCSANKITSLNLASKTSLKELNCSQNQLTSLNVQGCSAMTYLYCQNNNLTSLYVQGCTALTTVNCSVNQMSASGMTTLVNSLPTRSASSKGSLYALYNTGESNVFTSAHAATAAAKYWDPYRYNGSAWVLITATTRGDVDGNGKVSIDDVTALINYLLTNNASQIVLENADAYEDGRISIDDVTALINYLLSGTW